MGDVIICHHFLILLDQIALLCLAFGARRELAAINESTIATGEEVAGKGGHLAVLLLPFLRLRRRFLLGLLWLVHVDTLHWASRHFGAYSNTRYRAMLVFFGGDIFLSGSSGNVFGKVWKKGIMALSFFHTAGCRFGGEHLHSGSNHINSGTLNTFLVGILALRQAAFDVDF